MAEKLRVLILGGGFSGVFVAKALRKAAKKGLINVDLINQTNYFIFQPLLPEVSSGSISASDAVSPLRTLLPGIQVRLAEIIAVDFSAKKVTVIQGKKKWPIELDYDHLVLAMGQHVHLANFPGLTEHALTMKTMMDAFHLRNHIIGCLENADVTTDPEIKKSLLTFIVVGAGFSGVETVGGIKEMIDRSLKFYSNIKPEEIRVMLVEYADRILLELSDSLSHYAAKSLKKQGVEIETGTAIQSATENSIMLSDGHQIPTQTVVATIGNGPNPLIESLPLDLHWGRIKVERTMRVPGHQNLWALGDAALIPLIDDPQEDRHHYAPPTAQFAVREGEQLAGNILASLKGKPLKPFAYKSKGSLASLGTSKAVAEVGGLKFSGISAWLLWRGFYLSFLPGFATRLRVLISWMLNLFVPRNLVQIELTHKEATRYLHYRVNELVFEPGMRADGFYTILKGAFELKVDHPKTGEKIELRLGPGDHFGERVILGEDKTTGLIRAVEDSVVLRIERGDFERFATALPVLDDYFNDYIQKTFKHKTSPTKE